MSPQKMEEGDGPKLGTWACDPKPQPKTAIQGRNSPRTIWEMKIIKKKLLADNHKQCMCTYLCEYPAVKFADDNSVVQMRGCLNVTFDSALCCNGKLSMNAIILLRITSLAAVNSSFPTPSAEADVHCAAVPSV